jgi:hypothetical protein
MARAGPGVTGRLKRMVWPHGGRCIWWCPPWHQGREASCVCGGEFRNVYRLRGHILWEALFGNLLTEHAEEG